MNNYCHGFTLRIQTPIRKSLCDALRNLVPFARFKKHENTNGRVLFFVKFQAKPGNFTKRGTPP